MIFYSIGLLFFLYEYFPLGIYFTKIMFQLTGKIKNNKTGNDQSYGIFLEGEVLFENCVLSLCKAF